MDGSDRIIVVGAGIAGLATALHLAAQRTPLKVTLITAGTPGTEAATGWAQGGIAAALGPDDHADLHAVDTLKVCNTSAGNLVVTSITSSNPEFEVVAPSLSQVRSARAAPA